MKISGWILAGLVVTAAACSSATDTAVDASVCAQTYEFGNYGCGRFDVTVDQPAQLPSAYMIQLSIASVRADAAFLGDVGLLGGFGTVTSTATLMGKPAIGDTMSVWVKATVLDNSTLIVGKPLPVYAVDSVLIVARFAPVGSRKPINTVHLTPVRLSSRAERRI